MAQRRPPRLEIADGGGTTITSTQTAIVGKKVTLQVRSNPSGQTLSNVSWTIPDEKVKNYTQSSTAATRTNLAAADLQRTTISFYWISGGTKTVEVTATLAGSPARATATFNVLAPTGMSMASRTGTVQVTTGSWTSGVTELHYGTPATPGISWTFTATAPAGGAGEIAGTQTIRTNRSRTLNSGTVEHFTSGSRWDLDNTAPYASARGIAAGAAATWTSSDSPGTPLTSNLRAKSVGDDFRMYFMYKPSGADSIWVTIGRLEWHWRGATTRTGAPAATTNNWTAPAGADPPAGTNPSGTASTELPVWTSNFTDLAWT